MRSFVLPFATLLGALPLAACGSGSSPAGASFDASARVEATGSDDARAHPNDGPASQDAAHPRDAAHPKPKPDAGAHDAARDGAPTPKDGASNPPPPPLPPLPSGTGTGTTYYVSPHGLDSHDGLSPTTAWLTVDKVSASSFGPGDTVLFEGGQTFAGCAVFSSEHVKSTADAPLSVGAYGTGSFTLTATCSGAHAAALSALGLNGFYLHDAIIQGNDGGAEYGVFVVNTTGTPTQGVRVEGCDISGFYSDSQTDYGGEIFIAGDPGPIDQVYVLHNTLHGTSGPTSKDENGITGYGSGGITHALYQGNTVFDMGGKPGVLGGSIGNCILAIGIDGGLVQYNVAHGCGGNTTTCGGPAGIWTYGSNDVVIQYNEAYASGPAGVLPQGACDWNGYDLDGNVTNSTLQYNYSHDNYGAGYLTYVNGTWSGNTIRYNVSQNDGRGLGLGGSAPDTSDLQIYGNTLYSDSSAAMVAELGFTGGGSVGGRVFNNIFFMAGKGQLVSVEPWNTAADTGLVFLGNDYYGPATFTVVWNGSTYTSLAAWAAATTEETQSGAVIGRTTDPQLMAPGTSGVVDGYAPERLSGYRLQPSSPMIGVGLAPPTLGVDAGTTDFFGHVIPGSVGTGYNVGADGAE